MDNQPLISIILPCYNAERYLQEALNSLIKQSYKRIEVLAINDGSTDKTLKIIINNSKKDNRIVIINNEKNIGLIKSLNKGIELAKGKYIARMDADDIADLNRLSSQKLFLEKNNFDLVSSGYSEINSEGETIGHSFIKSTKPNSCFFQSFFSNPIAHPLLLIKAEIIKSNKYGGVDTEHSEDFELWNRLGMKGFKIGNETKELLKYRKTKSSVSNKYEKIQIKNHNLISKKNIEAFFGFKIEEEVISVLNNRTSNKNNFSDIFKANHFLKKMTKHFKKLNLEREEVREIEKVYLYQIIDISLQAMLKHSLQLKVGGLILFIYKTPQIIFGGGITYIKSKV